MLPLVYATLSVTPTSTLTPSLFPPHRHVLIKQIILPSTPPPLPPPPPLCMHTAEELLIYIFGHDTFQLVVVSPSVCHWYATHHPSSSFLLNDILFLLASLPLSGSILHKSVRPLYPSKANDHHLFSSTAVKVFFFSLNLLFPPSSALT